MAEGSHLQIRVRKVSPRVSEVAIDGFLDFSTSEKLERALQEIFGNGSYRLVFDLSRTKYVSSSGIGCFIEAADIAGRNGGGVVFAGVAPHVKSVFDILGLTGVFRFVSNPSEGCEQLEREG